MKKTSFLFVAIIFSIHLFAQDFNLYEKKTLIEGDDTLRYRILYPENYNKNKSYPLIIFLHGIGERGYDNEAQLIHGGSLFLKDSLRKTFPAIVIFPQCPPTTIWGGMTPSISGAGKYQLSETFLLNPSTEEKLVKKLIDNLIEKKVVDRKRIYIGGLSMGGFGAYDMLTRYGNYFAAAFVICGQSHVDMMVNSAKKIPLWIFHGAKDNIVSIEADRELYKALIDAGDKKVMYTEYPNANHDSWDSAFAEPQLLPWLFKQHN